MSDQSTRGIKDLAPKLSDAVRAMIEGLKRQDSRKGFIVEMGAFCSSDGEICCGCAALCALQEITHKDIIPSVAGKGRYVRSKFFSIHFGDLVNFEYAIDQFRRGYPLSLVSLYEDTNLTPWEVLHPDLPALYSSDWRQGVPVYEAYLRKLLSLGL